MSNSTGAASASSPLVAQQDAALPAGTAASGGNSVGTRSEVLTEATKHIEAETPWFTALGLRYEEVEDEGSELAVETVLAYNVVRGLLDATSANALAPVLVLLKGMLLDAVHGAVAAREEILELIRYCLGISRCLLEAAGAGDDTPRSTAAALGEFKTEVEAVGRFVQTYGTRSDACCGRTGVLSSRERDAATGHEQKLKDLLDTVLAALSAQTHLGAKEPKRVVSDRAPLRPRPRPLAEIPREAPTLPATYVQRTGMLDRVVADLTNRRRPASATHCLVGTGGGGKTLMASSVVRDERVRDSFRDGMFWVTVGREGKDVALLLEYLAVELARAPADEPLAYNACPDRFNCAGEVVLHLADVRKQGGLRCLVVLDNVWDAEVVNAFASTGFHVLLTTRRGAVIPPAHAGACTEVGHMPEEDALEVLRKASGAHRPLPAEEAHRVARDCGMLPLALGMAGTLARGRPMDPASWRRVHENLREKHAKFRGMENARLFSAIDSSLCELPFTQQEQLRLMAVMASGIVATREMLANLWKQHITDVPTGARVLVDRCLLQDQLDGYRLHDLVLEYLQLAIAMGGGRLARRASSRQAKYLARVEVFKQYNARGTEVSTGGLYTLVALWNSVKRLGGSVNVEACYKKSLEGVAEIEIKRQVGWVLLLLGHYAGAEAMLRDTLTGAEDRSDQLVEFGYTLGVLAGALKEQGKYDEADPLYLKVTDLMEKALGPDHPNVAVCLHNRALLLAEQGKLEKADRLHVRCIEIEEKALGPDHPQLALSLNTRAGLLRTRGELEKADALLVRAIKIQKIAVGWDHPSLTNSLGTRAAVLEGQGKYDHADHLHRRCIEIQEKALGADHPELATSLNNRARLLRTQGTLEEADLLSVRAIEIQEASLGPIHPGLATSLTSRAIGLQAQGKLEEAYPLLARAQEIVETSLGLEHPLLASVLGSRADVLRAEGNCGEADSLYLRCIEIKEKALGPDHPELAGNLISRAGLLQAQGKFEEADPVLVRAIEIQEKALGPDHPRLATSLGTRAAVLQAQGKHDEADRLCLRRIEIEERALGSHHPELAASLCIRADLLRAQGKLEKADPLLARAIAIQEEALGPDHPSLASPLDGRATLLSAQGKLDEADPLYRRAIEIQQVSLGPDHPDLAVSFNNRGGLLKAQGKLDEADTLLERAIEIQERALGHDHPDVAQSLGGRATVLHAQGKLDEADRLYSRSIEIEEKALGPDHPRLAGSLNNRAGLLEAQGKLDEARSHLERALAIQGKSLREEHRTTTVVMDALKRLDETQGRTEEGDPRSVTNRLRAEAELLANQGKYEETDRLYQTAINTLENGLGLDHPRVADVLDLRASLCKSQGKFEEADSLYRRSIRIKEQAPDVHPLSLADSLNSRAMELHAQQSFDEAEPLAVRAIGIEESDPGPARPNLACYLDTLAEVKKAQGKCEEADPLYLRAINIFEQTIGPGHPVLAETLHNRAMLLNAQRNYREAKPIFERALAIRKEKLGEGHQDTVLTLEALKQLERSQYEQVPGTE